MTTLPPFRLPDPNLDWPIIKEGVYLLCSRERCSNKTYLDWPGRKPTKGWGETQGVRMGDTPWTNEECDQRLLQSLKEYTQEVISMLKVPASDHQLAGFVVCAYNIGLAGLRGSSMMRLHNQGKFEAAARAFSLWNKATDAATGKLIEVAELTSRRAAEAAMYLTPDDHEAVMPTPQVVAPQPSSATSPTMTTGAGAVGVGGATLVLSSLKDFGGQATDIAKDFASDLGLTPVQALAAILLIVGAVVWYRRWKDSQEGRK